MSNSPIHPDDVRSRAVKMRDLLRTIQNAPLAEVVTATAKLGEEIEGLIALANAASAIRRL